MGREWQIYNQYGERLFYTQNLNDSWDGTYNGDACQAGVYFYQIQYHGIKTPDNTLIKSGNVTLIR